MRRTTTKHSFFRGFFFAIFALALSFSTIGCDDDNGTSVKQQTMSGTITFKYDGVVMSADSMAAHFPHGTPDTADFPGYLRVAIMKTDANGKMLSQGPVGGIPSTGEYVGFKFSDLTDGTYSFAKSLDEGTYIMLMTYVYTFNDDNGANNTYIGVAHYGDKTPTPITISNEDVSGLDMVVDVKTCKDTLATLQYGTLSGTITINDPNEWDNVINGSKMLFIRGYKEGSSLYSDPVFKYSIAKPEAGKNKITYSKAIQFGTYTTLQVGVFSPPRDFKTLGDLIPSGSLTVDDNNKKPTKDVTITLTSE